VPPTPTFPEARLPRRMRQAAERKQAEYRKAVRQQEEVETKRKKGVLASLLLGDDDDDESARPVGASSTSVVTEEPPPSKQEEWFDFLSDRAPAASTVSSVAEPEVRTEKKESDWFGWGKGKEKKKDEPDWFGAFGKPTGEAASVGDFIVDEERVDAPEVVVEEKKKEEADWFSWLAPKGEPGDVSPDASATEPPPLVSEPAPKEPVLEPTPDEEGRKKKSVLGKIFGAVPSVSVEIPKPVGIERMKPELVEKPKPVAIEKPKPAVVEKPKPVVVEKPKPKREEKVAVEVEEAPTVVVPEMSTYVLPDPKKLFWGGEDATFVKGRTFGVFDGVSGADKVDGVPLYSLTLAREMKSRVGTSGMEMKDMIDALAACVEVANKRATGASTALVGSISDDGVLRVLNVGDCTAIVVRGEKVVARTKEINHFYECPYQFSEISPDRPRDGTRLNLSLKKGDIIIAGSDGVFDNLEEEQIVREVTSSPRKAGIIAKRVSDLSRRISQNPKAITPFSKLALKKKNPDYPDGIGGKVDDVCCVAICYG
jgi:protein phosphatase PTC7